MSAQKAEKFYTALMDLQNELEETILKKFQKILKEILAGEKVSLLYKIHKLVEEEWTEVLTEAQEESKSHRVQNFLCNSCNKNFTSVSDGEGYENADGDYYNSEEGRFYRSEDFISDDQDQENRDGDPILLSPEVIDDSEGSAAEVVEVDEFQPAAMIFNRNQFKNLPLTVQLLKGAHDNPISINSTEEEEEEEENQDGDTESNNFDANDFLSDSVAIPSSSNATRLAIQLQQIHQLRYQSQQTQKIPISSLMNSIKMNKDKKAKAYLQNKLKRYECPYCPYKTEFSANLKSHIRVHTGERPYLCRVCSKAFSQKSSLNSHERNVHGGRISTGNPT